MEGYSKVAELMGHHNEFGILRRFRTLNMQNLLYLQAELTYLESELKELAEVDQAHTGRKFYSKDWRSLAHSENDGDDRQWQKVLEIRAKLKEYSTAMYFLDMMAFLWRWH